MKARMRLLFTIPTDTGGEWRGDCPEWAEEGRRAGLTVTTTHVLWVGKPWPCYATWHKH